MRILLVAYDFPPIPSPQALRWAYLVRELALAGHDVHVLAPDVMGYGVGQLPELPASVVVHRSSAGPVTDFLVARQRANRQPHQDDEQRHREGKPDRLGGLF